MLWPSPVMEGKACLFKRFGGVDAYPICLNTKDPEEIVRAVQLIAPGFGGINLEDISAPRCFEIEERLIETLDIPVFHDDQHGTAVVVLAAVGVCAAAHGSQRIFSGTEVLGVELGGLTREQAQERWLERGAPIRRLTSLSTAGAYSR